MALSTPESGSLPDVKLRLDHRPLYVQAEDALRELLESGTFQPGQQLPTEPDLAQQLGISRSTLREAMRTFEEQGWVTRRQGVGTFVNQSPPLVIESGLETLESIDSLVRRRGISMRTRSLQIEEEQVSADLADAMSLEAGDAVTIVTRTKMAAKRAVAYMVDALPRTIASPEDVLDGFQGSVLDFLLARPDLNVAHARADIVPMQADDFLADQLGISPGHVLLLLEETYYDNMGQVIDFSRNYFVPEFFKFHLVRSVDRRS